MTERGAPSDGYPLLARSPLKLQKIWTGPSVSAGFKTIELRDQIMG